MATAHLTSVEEYLHSTFEPDAEYIEGRVIPRSMPGKPHSRVHTELIFVLCQVARPQGYKVWNEQRIRTRTNPPRYRVPDVCVTRGEPDEDVFTAPPFLCVEVLSPDDSAIDVRVKTDEYLSHGVEWVWIIEPETRTGEIHSRDSIQKVVDGRFHAGDISVDLNNA